MGLFAVCVLSGIILVYSIFSLYLYSFSRNQSLLFLVTLLFSGVFTGTALSIIRWFLVRANKMRKNLLFRLVQTGAVIAVPFFVSGVVIRGAAHYNLQVTEKTYLPVIREIENTITDSGHPPTDILSILGIIDLGAAKGRFPLEMYYYRDDDAYSLSIDSGSLDIDGSVNYWDSQKKKWINIHNDILQYVGNEAIQHPEYNEDASTFIQSYQSLPQIRYGYEKGQWIIRENEY